MTRTTVVNAIKDMLAGHAERGRRIEGARVVMNAATHTVLGWDSMSTDHGRVTIGVDDTMADGEVDVSRFGRGAR